MAQRQCPHCGKMWPATMQVCPVCRENLLDIPEVRGLGRGVQGRAEMRRGFFYMLFASALYYLASDRSPIQIPFETDPWLSEYILPFMFLAGMGLVVLGLYRRVTA